MSFNEIVSVPTASYLNGFELDLDVPPADGDLLIYNTDTSAWENSKTLTGNYTVSGSLTIRDNFTVLGSASITYISESTLNIGTNLITVNTINPGARFGGLAVIDSGSSPLVSASFLYDSVQDEFIFVHKGTAGGAVTSSHFILGPETYNDLGNEIYLTANRIPKGTGIEHLNDSNISDDGSVIKTISGSNDIGLKLDFANNSYILGKDIDFSILVDVNPKVVSLGDWNFSNNGTSWNLDDNNQTIRTTNQGNDIGLIVDFANTYYRLGTDDQGLLIYLNTNRYYFGDAGSINNGSVFFVDDGNSIIKTTYQSNDIGLKLDFVNNQFTLGDENQINGYGFIRLSNNSNFQNNQIELNASSFSAGDLFSIGNQTYFIVNDNNQIIQTQYGGNDIGLKLDFSSSKYELGQLTGGNQTKLTIDDATQTVTITGSVAVTGLSAGTGSSHVIMYNTASGQFFFTGSSAIGGGNASNDNFQQLFLLMGG